MSTNSKFETARCDDESDSGNDVGSGFKDKETYVSTYFGSDSASATYVSTYLGSDSGDDVSSCVESDYDGEFCGSFDWQAATEQVLRNYGFQRATPTTPTKIFTMCAGTDGPVKSLEESVGTDCVDHFASCDINPTCLDFVQANFAPRHFYKDVATLLDDDAYCAICDGPCIAFHDETADVLVAGRSRKFRVV